MYRRDDAFRNFEQRRRKAKVFSIVDSPTFIWRKKVDQRTVTTEC